MVYIWLGVLIATLVVEAVTFGLVAIWFAFGALASVIITLLGGGFTAQMLSFSFVSASLILLFVFCFKKKFNKTEATNVESLINASGVVEKTIEEKGRGRVLVSFMSWQAEEESGKEVQEGEWVKVIDIRGVTLIVKKEKENEEEKN